MLEVVYIPKNLLIKINERSGQLERSQLLATHYSEGWVIRALFYVEDKIYKNRNNGNVYYFSCILIRQM